MPTLISARTVLNSFVPISRFNKGEASKIINEVQTDGMKFIVKNNTPECVMLSVESYKKLLDALEDAEDLLVAEKRLASSEKTFSFEEVLNNSGITQKDLDDIDNSEIEFE